MKKLIVLSIMACCIAINPAYAKSKGALSLEEARTEARERLQRLEKMTPQQWKQIQEDRIKEKSDWKQLSKDKKKVVRKQRMEFSKRLETLSPDQRQAVMVEFDASRDKLRTMSIEEREAFKKELLDKHTSKKK